MTAPRPYALLAEITYRCPLHCPYCSNPLELDGRERELDTASWSQVFSEAAAVGVLQLHLSGGEPAVRHDLVSVFAARGHKTAAWRASGSLRAGKSNEGTDFVAFPPWRDGVACRDTC